MKEKETKKERMKETQIERKKYRIKHDQHNGKKEVTGQRKTTEKKNETKLEQ